jgi:hypothetical protein
MAAAVTAEAVEVREIGPDEARALLSANDHNRRLRERRVEELAGAMVRGEWQFNGDPIRIASSGRLLDGQHRLAAIERSGLTQRMVIISGLPEQSQETMDAGLRRGVADALALRGEKSTTQLASAARALFLYETYGTFKEPRVPATTQQVLATIDRHPELRDAVRATDRVRKNTFLVASIAGSLWVLFGEVDQEDRTAFFLRLAEGVELERTDPIFALRRIVTAKRPVGNPLRPYIQAALMIKAWNAWRAGEEVRMLIWRPGGAARETFPQIEGREAR